MDLSGKTNALRKGLRTALQVIVSIVPVLVAAAAGLPGKYSALVLGVSVPLVSFAVNLLEDQGIIGTWLRRPTPVDAAAALRHAGRKF